MGRAIGEDRPLKTDGVLTKAETRVASGYVCGLIGKEIADACDISHNTVIRHTQNIYAKTGIKHSTNALVAWFLEKNYDLDIREIKRRIIAVVLLALACLEIVSTDFDSPYLKRVKAKRSAACRVWGRPRARRKGNTYHLTHE